jgi:hypothetical protein
MPRLNQGELLIEKVNLPSYDIIRLDPKDVDDIDWC